MTDGARIVCRSITLKEARELPRIPSCFQTDRVFKLRTDTLQAEPNWTLGTENLTIPLGKTLDTGILDEWLESYRDEVNSSDLHFTAAYINHQIAGLLTWRPLRWNETLWMLDIRTQPDSRRRGVGSALVNAMKREARKLRFRGISLETQPDNYPAMCFYQRQGFEISGFNDRLYTNRSDESGAVAIFMFWERD